MRRLNSRSVSTGHDAPPVITTRNEDKSRRSRSGSLSIAMIEAGAVEILVTRSRSISSSAARPEKRSSNTALAQSIKACISSR